MKSGMRFRMLIRHSEKWGDRQIISWMWSYRQVYLTILTTYSLLFSLFFFLSFFKYSRFSWVSKKSTDTHTVLRKRNLLFQENLLFYFYFLIKKKIYFLCFSQIFTWQLLLLLFVCFFFLLGKQKIHFACLFFFFLLSLLIFCFIIILEIFFLFVQKNYQLQRWVCVCTARFTSQYTRKY